MSARLWLCHLTGANSMNAGAYRKPVCLREPELHEEDVQLEVVMYDPIKRLIKRLHTAYFNHKV